MVSVFITGLRKLSLSKILIFMGILAIFWGDQIRENGATLGYILFVMGLIIYFRAGR